MENRLFLGIKMVCNEIYRIRKAQVQKNISIYCFGGDVRMNEKESESFQNTLHLGFPLLKQTMKKYQIFYFFNCFDCINTFRLIFFDISFINEVRILV